MRKEKQISLWLTPEELRNMKASAAKRGLSLSAYIRQCTKGKANSIPSSNHQYETLSLLTEVSDTIVSHASQIGMEEALRLRGILYKACGLLRDGEAHGL